MRVWRRLLGSIAVFLAVSLAACTQQSPPPPAPPAPPPLSDRARESFEKFKTGDWDATESAAMRLCELKSEACELVPELAPIVLDPAETEHRRAWGLIILQDISKGTKREAEATAAIVQALDAESPVIVNAACERLMNIGPSGHAAVPKLIRNYRGFKGPGAGLAAYHDRSYAAGALPEVANAPEAVPHILEAYKDERPEVRSFAVLGMVQEGTFATLLLALEDPSIEVQRAAYGMLGRFPQKGKDVIEPLRKALSAPESEKEGLLSSAFSSIVKLGLPGAKVLADEALKDTYPSERRVSIIGAFGRFNDPFKPASREIYQELLRVLDGAPLELRVVAARALPSMSPNGEIAIPELIKRLREPRAELRRACAEAVNSILTTDAERRIEMTEVYLPALVQSLDFDDPEDKKLLLRAYVVCSASDHNPQVQLYIDGIQSRSNSTERRLARACALRGFARICEEEPLAKEREWKRPLVERLSVLIEMAKIEGPIGGEIIEAIGWLGPAAALAAKPIEALRERHPERVKQALERLNRALESKNPVSTGGDE